MINLTPNTTGSVGKLAIAVGIAIVGLSNAMAADLLVADRLSNSVYRFSDSGQLLGTVVDGQATEGQPSQYLNQPTGIGISPDYTKLYVSSSQDTHVVQYDYNAFTGKATNPTIFADASDGLAFPNDIKFSPDGSKVYMANLDGGVSQFYADGTSAGPKLVMPPPPDGGFFATSSMNFLPSGELLAGAFQDFPAGTNGGVAISDSSVSSLPGFLVQPTPAVNGATGLMVHDGYIYLTGLFSFNIRRFSLGDGQMDTSWGVTGVFFPQDLIEAPDENGFLAGILGFSNGTGNISRYAFDGTFLSIFAEPSEAGFTEATAFVTVPTPLLGDYNSDGVVDAADYTVWRDYSGSTEWLPNDDTPGVIDASDYENWRANYGNSLTLGETGSSFEVVPEPSFAALALLASACCCGAHRRVCVLRRRY